jgi:hypothetical protein
VHAPHGRSKRVRAVRRETGDDAGQRVAGARGREPDVAGRVAEDRASGRRDEGARLLSATTGRMSTAARPAVSAASPTSGCGSGQRARRRAVTARVEAAPVARACSLRRDGGIGLARDDLARLGHGRDVVEELELHGPAPAE